MDTLDRERILKLMRLCIESTSDFERGYYQGRWAEFVQQNAIAPELLPALWAEARKDVVEGHS